MNTIPHLGLTCALIRISMALLQAHPDVPDHQPLHWMTKVADWQLAHFDTDPVWINAVFTIGVMSLYSVQAEKKYLSAMLSYAEANQWQPGKDFRNANDLAVGQLYTELYLLQKDPKMLEPFQHRIDQIMKQPMPGRKDWWWCDALFMAPPALVRLGVATNDSRYVEFLDGQWWDAAGYLYDGDRHLFYRDDRFFNRTEKNGEKVFWSRGNGWVMAGTVRVLQFLDGSSLLRARYVALFQEMAAKVASIQQDDGFWRTSLLDPEDFPGNETSGTGFFCYAIAWGINQNLLPRNQYLQVVTKAWEALKSAVEPSGRLGWVQPTGDAPGPVSANDSLPYGAGAFLLAGSEMHRLFQDGDF